MHPILNKIWISALLERCNPRNPECTVCGMRQSPNHLYNGLCAQCADDEVQKKTGCRFGDVLRCNPVTHPDCWRKPG